MQNYFPVPSDEVPCGLRVAFAVAGLVNLVIVTCAVYVLALTPLKLWFV
jgi:hypothetical protein